MQKMTNDIGLVPSKDGKFILTKSGMKQKLVTLFRSRMKLAGATQINHPGSGRFKHFEVEPEKWNRVQAMLAYMFPGQTMNHIDPNTMQIWGVATLPTWTPRTPSQAEAVLKVVKAVPEMETVGSYKGGLSWTEKNLLKKARFLESEETSQDKAVVSVPQKDAPKETTQASHKVKPEIRLVEAGDFIEVYTPFNRSFMKELKTIPGREARYDKQKGKRDQFVCWKVPVTEKSTLRHTLAQHFLGKEAEGPKGLFTISA